MTWFKVDDSLHSHVKTMRAGEAAMGLWVLAGSWCADYLTDGWIPAYAAKRLSPNAEALADELVRAGLWSVDERDGEAGWLFHGWDEYQPSRESVQQRRKSDAERRARWRVKSASRSESRRDAPRESQRASRGESQEASRCESVLPDPTRPVPDTSTEVSAPCSPPQAGEATTRKPAKATPDRFDEFWSTYPKRVAKQAAIKAWRKAIKIADPDTIINGARRYAEARRGDDPQYTAHPSTWLNAGRWDDEPQPSAPPAMSTRDRRVAETQQLKARLLGDTDTDTGGEGPQLRAISGGGW